MKACRFCASMIQDEAIKCRHCGAWQDPQEEAKRAAAAVGPTPLAVKIYSYLLMALGAVYTLVMAVGFLAVGSRDAESGGATAFAGGIAISLAVAAGIVFLALGLLKLKRIAYILNLILLGLAVIAVVLMAVFIKVPDFLYSAIPMVLYAGGWLAYFISQKRSFLHG